MPAGIAIASRQKRPLSSNDPLSSLFNLGGCGEALVVFEETTPGFSLRAECMLVLAK
jgi:hypothetical protein